MRINYIVAFSVLFLTWLAPATARTYRWVDENGVTIYSQSRPPSGTNATVIKAPPPAPASESSGTTNKLKARLEASEKAKKEKNEAKEKEEKTIRNAEIKKQNCENAKKNLSSLELHPRIKKKMDDGEYKILSDEERTADIEKAKKAIKKYCE